MNDKDLAVNVPSQLKSQNPHRPNTASIPNILFDYWMAKISLGELAVLMCVARKTYGFNKDNDRISLSQIEKMTGLSRRGIVKSIDSLIARNLILKIKSKTFDGDDAPNQYEINVDYEIPPEEQIGSQLSLLGSERSSLPHERSSLGGRERSSLGVGNVVYTQNTTYKTHMKDKTPLKVPHPENSNAKHNIHCQPEDEDGPSAAMPAKAGENVLGSPEKVPKKKAEFSQEARDLTGHLIATLTRHEPDYTPPKNLAPFMQEVDLMLRVNKWDPLKIVQVLSWALTDNFWRGKVFKPNPAKYLRTNFLDWKRTMEAPPISHNKVDRRNRDKNGKPIEDAFKDNLF